MAQVIRWRQQMAPSCGKSGAKEHPINESVQLCKLKIRRRHQGGPMSCMLWRRIGAFCSRAMLLGAFRGQKSDSCAQHSNNVYLDAPKRTVLDIAEGTIDVVSSNSAAQAGVSALRSLSSHVSLVNHRYHRGIEVTLDALSI